MIGEEASTTPPESTEDKTITPPPGVELRQNGMMTENSVSSPNRQESPNELSGKVHWIQHATFWSQVALGTIGVAALCIYKGQLREMAKSTVATQQAAYAACLAARIAQSSLIETQKSMSDTHGSTQAAIYQALAATQSEAADVTIIAIREEVEAGKPFRMIYAVKNEGKTAANNLHVDLRLEFVPRDAKVYMSYPKARISEIDATRFPAGHTEPQKYPQGPNQPDAQVVAVTKQKNGDLQLATPQDVKDYQLGVKDVIFYARFTYRDMFGVHHNGRFCESRTFIGRGSQIHTPHPECWAYNRNDANTAVKPLPPLAPSVPPTEIICPVPK